MKKPCIIIQARTGSTRLPSKMTLPFFNGMSVLQILLTRITESIPEIQNNIIVATTTNPKDNQIVQVCDLMKVPCFRGSENDVLNRFISAAESLEATKIIRICADNVFLDMQSLRKLYNELDKDQEYDYISFCKTDNTPSIKTHYGFWAEGVTLKALHRVSSMTEDTLYHEHVTNYIYGNPDKFKCRFMSIDPQIEKCSQLRLTLDTQEDFEIQTRIYADLVTSEQELSPFNLIKYLDKHQDIYNKMYTIINNNLK